MNNKETFKSFVENVQSWNRHFAKGERPSFDAQGRIRIDVDAADLARTQLALNEYDPVLGRLYAEQVAALRKVYDMSAKIMDHVAQKTERAS